MSNSKNMIAKYFKAMNVFDTKHNYSVQESLHLIATPPLSLGKVSWIFKDQDHQRSSPSEKSFFSTPPPPPLPFNLQRNFFFSHVPQKYNNNQSSWGSDPLPPSFKRANYSLNTNYLRSFWNWAVLVRKLDLHIKLYVFQQKFLFRRQNPHWFSWALIWGANSTGHPHNMSV